MFSITCEYALRALSRLAQVPEGQSLLGRELAANADIPANYLSKILLALRNAGILHAARGTGGGYRLRKTPESIRLMDVVDLFDAPRARPACLLCSEKECSDEAPCAAHGDWRAVREAYVRFIENTSIAAIVDGHKPERT
jgi:Rrf2 family transcriptional regulator, iron-sulfur cluster assembly transcription factor